MAGEYLDQLMISAMRWRADVVISANILSRKPAYSRELIGARPGFVDPVGGVVEVVERLR